MLDISDQNMVGVMRTVCAGNVVTMPDYVTQYCFVAHR
jgi:hypothetical protein